MTHPTPEKMSLALPADGCAICCHETRNAIASVSYFARQVRRLHPGMPVILLDAAIARLDRAQRLCATPAPTDDPEPAPAKTARPSACKGDFI